MKMNHSSAMKLRSLPDVGMLDEGIGLFSSVSFSFVTSMYTYTYLVDNRTRLVPVTEINILVDSINQSFTLMPDSENGPPGWQFSNGVSGTSANPPLNEFGTFWSWDNEAGVDSGMVSAPFSFTIARAPTLVVKNNFFLYTNSLFDGGTISEIVGYGHVIAPDLGVPFPPE